jgi:hypothetical protein
VGIFSKLNFKAVDQAGKDLAALNFVAWVVVRTFEACENQDTCVDISSICDATTMEIAQSINNASDGGLELATSLHRLEFVSGSIKRNLINKIGSNPSGYEIGQELMPMYDVIGRKLLKAAKKGYLPLSVTDVHYLIEKLEDEIKTSGLRLAGRNEEYISELADEYDAELIAAMERLDGSATSSEESPKAPSNKSRAGKSGHPPETTLDLMKRREEERLTKQRNQDRRVKQKKRDATSQFSNNILNCIQCNQALNIAGRELGKVACPTCSKPLRIIEGNNRTINCDNCDACHHIWVMAGADVAPKKPTKKAPKPESISPREKKVNETNNCDLENGVLRCINCNQALNIPTGKNLKIRCPKCDHSWMHKGTIGNENGQLSKDNSSEINEDGVKRRLVEANTPAVNNGMLVEHIGIETHNGDLSLLIIAGTKIPHEAKQVFSTALDMQREISAKIYRGIALTTSNSTFLGSFVMSVDPPAPKGVPQIELSVTVTETDIFVSFKNITEG